MAVASNPLETFIWGAGGQKMSPEQVARQREIAAALMQGGMDYSPVEHWAQGLARASQGLVGGLKDRWAGEAEQRGREGFQSQWDSVFGGGGSASPVAAALAGGGAGGGPVPPASIPSGDNAAYIRQGLIQRGLPEHVADAFLLNMQDESGLNPGINEAAPIVPGSRGGYGLYQLTGPRRRAYEAYAQQSGIPLDSIDGQLDFLMSELAGPEANAYQAIMAAPDTGSAAAAIVNQFLRPSEQHRARREAAYLGGASMPPRNQVAQAGGGMGPYGAGDTSLERFGPDGERFTRSSPNEPWNRASHFGDGGRSQGGGNPSVAQLLSLAGNEWANPGQSSVVSALLGQAMQQQDPMYQLQRQKAELELEALRNPAAPAPVFEGGQWWDVSGGMPTAISDRAVDPTSGIQNYEYLVGQGLDPQAAIDRAFSGGVNVNIPGQPNIGSIPPGYSAVQDENGAWSMAPIPGSPAAVEAEQAASQADMRSAQSGRYADVVLDDIDRALGMTGADTTGILGTLLQNVPGTNSRNLDALLQTIRSNIGFDRLQAMREASPTGGALGAVSDFENRQLQSTLGNLEQSQTEDQLRRNLERVRETYLDIIHGPGNRPGEQSQSTVDPSDIDALLELYR